MAVITTILSTDNGTTSLTEINSNFAALNTDMTATVGGLVPTPPNDTSKFLRGDGTFATPSGSSGTVTTVSVATANGFSGTVATATTTPAITIVAGAINPTSVNGITISGSSTPTLAVTGTTTISGANTGDQTTVSGNAGTATKLATARTIAITGDLAYTSPSFDGSGNVTATGTLATVNSNVGSFGSATQSSVVTVNAKGLVTAASNSTVTPAVGSITGFGTGVGTALAINVGSAGAPVTFNGALGTPSSGTATNLTGTASGLTAGNVTTNANLTGAVTSSGNATSLGSFSSASLLGALTDETGTGKAVFASKPTFIGTVNTVVAVAALALDGSLGSIFTKTIATGSTFTQSNFSTGQCFMLKITGAFTPTWFSGVTWITSGGTAPTQGAITTYGFVCTGSNTFDAYLVGTQ